MVFSVVALLVAAGLGAIRVIASRETSADLDTPSQWTRGSASNRLAGLAASTAVGTVPEVRTKRTVYPYSVVPGGVQSPQDLEQAAAHDKVVATHYAGFDFKRARLIELKHSQLMYLSYRMRDKIYWTSKRIKLHAGETVISDGKMIARTRCANQLSESAKHAASPEEPPAEKFDEPFIADGGSAMKSPFPGTFESAQHNLPAFDGAGGTAPLSNSYLFGPGVGGGFPPVFPPPLPGGAGACNTIFPSRDERGSDSGIEDTTVKRNCPKKPGTGNGPPPPVVPEPGTIFLFTSGVAGIYMRYRKAKT
jgi:PEP-CTERM motif-containing protein